MKDAGAGGRGPSARPARPPPRGAGGGGAGRWLRCPSGCPSPVHRRCPPGCQLYCHEAHKSGARGRNGPSVEAQSSRGRGSARVDRLPGGSLGGGGGGAGGGGGGGGGVRGGGVVG